MNYMLLIFGGGCMVASVWIWATAEWGILALKGSFGVPLSLALQAGFATILYWFGFFLLVTPIYRLWGASSAFVMWAVSGVVFEIITFSLVVFRTGKGKGLLAPAPLFYFVGSLVLIFLLGRFAERLYTLLGIE